MFEGIRVLGLWDSKLLGLWGLGVRGWLGPFAPSSCYPSWFEARVWGWIPRTNTWMSIPSADGRISLMNIDGTASLTSWSLSGLARASHEVVEADTCGNAGATPEALC